jgi:SAM-dependent methyltransferase
VVPTSTSPTSWAPTLGRSVRLFNAFLVEQTDRDQFYETLAADSVGQLGEYCQLDQAVVVDIGGGPGYFKQAFERAGSRYIGVEADVGELSMRGQIEPGSVLGSGFVLPFRDSCADVSYSSNVLEHVDEPWRVVDEMVRVTRPGGTIFVSYNTWWSPNGGHETAPWHYLGGEYAARRYTRRRGHEPKNRYGRTLFPLDVRSGLRYARRVAGVDVVDAVPRYHPRWARWIVRVPGVREVGTWNLVLVLKKR